MTPRLGAIIVNYNAGPELRQALESIDRATCGSWQAVVVDNGSTDGSEAAATAFVQVRLVRNSENVGFARGVNQAIRDCPADRILIETDSPYLSPHPLRGKRNEPAHLVHTAACLAEVRGVPLAEFARQTALNARTLLRLAT